MAAGCDAADAALQAERMREAIGGTPFLTPSRPVTVTASLGVACSSSSAPETLVREADGALYEAKGDGRNRVAVHSVIWGHAGCGMT